MRVFSSKIFGLDVFKHKESFILFMENNIAKEIGLIKKSVGRNIELDDKAISIINGVLYPLEDYNLLLKI